MCLSLVEERLRHEQLAEVRVMPKVVRTDAIATAVVRVGHDWAVLGGGHAGRRLRRQKPRVGLLPAARISAKRSTPSSVSSR